MLLFLAGGPGQSGITILPRIRAMFEQEVHEQYRLVVFDQRGTGAGGINCAALQAAVGGSDFLTPPVEAVAACARQLGDTRHCYTTPDTVEDIELLREALGVDRLTLDGISYGTFTAAHYALRNPARVRRMVLDSVVPHQGFDPFEVDTMRATGRVLRAACADNGGCDTDPADDLAWVVRHLRIDGAGLNGTRLLESLAILSMCTVGPTFSGVPETLHRARHGDLTMLVDFLDRHHGKGTRADESSAGLRLATMCADHSYPWGDASTRWLTGIHCSARRPSD